MCRSGEFVFISSIITCSCFIYSVEEAISLIIVSPSRFQNRRQGAKHSEHKRREQPALVSSSASGSASATNAIGSFPSPPYGSPDSLSQHSDSGVALGSYSHSGSHSPTLTRSVSSSSSHHSVSRSPLRDLRTRAQGRRMSVSELLRKEEEEESASEDTITPGGSVRIRNRTWEEEMEEDEEWQPASSNHRKA